MGKPPGETNLTAIAETAPDGKDGNGGNEGNGSAPRRLGVEALLGEVARHYQEQVAALHCEVDDLRATVVVEVQRQAALAQERARLQTALKAAERQRELLETRLDQAERRTGALSNLYLAAFTLHRQHEWQTVVRALADVLANQVGAASFSVALCQPDGTFTRIIDEGPRPVLPGAEELQTFLRHDQPQYGDRPPLALVPLTTFEGPLGVISIGELLPPKTELTGDDQKLLTALSCLAATALEAARRAEPHNLASDQPFEVDGVSGRTRLPQPSPSAAPPEAPSDPGLLTPDGGLAAGG